MLLRRKAIPLLVIATLVTLSFTSGFIACLHLKTALPDTLRKQNLLPAGNAPSAVRAEVLRSLSQLRDDYVWRNPGQVTSLRDHLLPRDGNILVLGTGSDEWIRGTSNAAQFIAADWRYWGDLRLDVDDATVWSSGNTAWLVTIGNVHFAKRTRPLRFTAILTREDDHWVFRQMQYEWDDNDPVKRDLLRPRSYLRLLTGTTY